MTQHRQPLVLNFVFPGKYVCVICLTLCTIVRWCSCFSDDESGKNCYLVYESLGIFIREILSWGGWEWGWVSDVRGTSGKCGHWGMGRKLWAGQWGTWRKVWGKSSLCVAVGLTVLIVMKMNFLSPSFSSSCLRIFILAAVYDILFTPYPHFLSHILAAVCDILFTLYPHFLSRSGCIVTLCSVRTPTSCHTFWLQSVTFCSLRTPTSCRTFWLQSVTFCSLSTPTSCHTFWLQSVTFCSLCTPTSCHTFWLQSVTFCSLCTPTSCHTFWLQCDCSLRTPTSCHTFSDLIQ